MNNPDLVVEGKAVIIAKCTSRPRWYKHALTPTATCRSRWREQVVVHSLITTGHLDIWDLTCYLTLCV